MITASLLEKYGSKIIKPFGLFIMLLQMYNRLMDTLSIQSIDQMSNYEHVLATLYLTSLCLKSRVLIQPAAFIDSY